MLQFSIKNRNGLLAIILCCMANVASAQESYDNDSKYEKKLSSLIGLNAKEESGENTSVKSIVVDNQIWMPSSLDVTTYRNGDPIPQVQDPEEWAELTTGAWCYYENDEGNGKVYRKLYNWYAVNDSRGLAPEGWHIPSDAEWEALIKYFGGEEAAEKKMKVFNVAKKDRMQVNRNSLNKNLGMTVWCLED